MRDQIVDFVWRWSEKTEIGAGRFIAWLGIAPSKFYSGRRVELTATEYELLRVLAQEAGRVLTHETLLRRVWAGRPAAAPKIVRAYVKRLRDKLGDEADRPALIVNERGVGYPHAPARRPVAPRPRGSGRSRRRRSRVSETVRDAQHRHACVAGMPRQRLDSPLGGGYPGF